MEPRSGFWQRARSKPPPEVTNKHLHVHLHSWFEYVNSHWRITAFPTRSRQTIHHPLIVISRSPKRPLITGDCEQNRATSAPETLPPHHHGGLLLLPAAIRCRVAAPLVLAMSTAVTTMPPTTTPSPAGNTAVRQTPFIRAVWSRTSGAVTSSSDWASAAAITVTIRPGGVRRTTRRRRRRRR